MRHFLFILIPFFLAINSAFSQETRLLRSPDINESHITFAYGGDIWITTLGDQSTLRLTSTPAVESNPHLSPDGKTVAFTSNRSGSDAIYTVSINGGSPKRLTFHPSQSIAIGWTPDGSKVLFASSRDAAPSRYNRLWTVNKDGGPSELLSNQWGNDGSYSENGKNIVLQPVSRWDSEWRGYRGGQNSPLIILNLTDNTETIIPNDERTIDIHPIWIKNQIYFLSDRDKTSNIWAYNTDTKEIKQITKFKGSDIKWLAGKNKNLCFEREGFVHIFDLTTNKSEKIKIELTGDFPWAETKWEDVSGDARSAVLSPNAKRVIIESRGEIFTVPAENGNTRNITLSSDAADRSPLWSPKGDQIAWFSDQSKKGYELIIADQDGISNIKKISIGISKLAWEPTWSPDGKFIAFADDDVRIQVIELASGIITTADVGGTNLERGDQGITWSPDSEWLAYSKTGLNGFRQIFVWSITEKKAYAMTNSFADSFSPAWDMDKKHMYFLASTDLALSSGWANTSSMTSRPEYAGYVINLKNGEPSPFKPLSDEEEVKKEEKTDTDSIKVNTDENKLEKEDLELPEKKETVKEEKKEEKITIDFDNIERRTMALPIDVANYVGMLTGPSGNVFIAERKPNTSGITLQKYSLEDRKSKEFLSGVGQASVSFDAQNMIARVGGSWKIFKTSGPKADEGKSLKVDLQIKLDRQQEWKQIFEEAWRYERDYFYDPNLHGRNWDDVHSRYAPLVPFIKHRADLTYILDQVNGELSVGHSFVFGGDYPETDKDKVGLLGADLVQDNGYWKITRIYTTESWNPELSSPLDRPDVNIKEGYYLVGINGKELTSGMDPFQFLDGTLDQITSIHINSEPNFKDAWKENVKPIRSENALRQRAWVEDNRRLVDKLSNGQLAYVWVPNTGGPGFVSFNRYLFAQQDKKGAIIDERFNGGGLLDDYMVDLLTREIRAALTNEVPNGVPLRLPGGILGPKVLLINEMAGSGGDFFPWVFRQQKAGALIGKRTWGGLVKSSVHYGLVDGGALTAPDNAVFDPVNGKWIAENEGVPPDIEVRQDAISLAQGKDPQLERAVTELLKTLSKINEQKIVPPAFSKPAKQ